jgi:hypothetical protein
MTLLDSFAKVIAEASGIPGPQAHRLAADLLEPTPTTTGVGGVPQSRLGRLRARIQAIPPLAKLARYLKRALYLPLAFHKFQSTFLEMQHTLRMIVQDQHRETRELIDKRNHELRRVLTQDIEELRGLLREQGRQGVLPDRRDAA